MWRFAPRLAAQGLRGRDPERLHAALELLVPPQSVLAVANLGVLALSLSARSRAGMLMSAGNLIGQAGFVLGGLALVRAPKEAYEALVGAPQLILQKLGIYAKVLSGRGPRRWVKTERASRRGPTGCSCRGARDGEGEPSPENPPQPERARKNRG
jgi:hypothetical protein